MRWITNMAVKRKPETILVKCDACNETEFGCRKCNGVGMIAMAEKKAK